MSLGFKKIRREKGEAKTKRSRKNIQSKVMHMRPSYRVHVWWRGITHSYSQKWTFHIMYWYVHRLRKRKRPFNENQIISWECSYIHHYWERSGYGHWECWVQENQTRSSTTEEKEVEDIFFWIYIPHIVWDAIPCIGLKLNNLWKRQMIDWRLSDSKSNSCRFEADHKARPWGWWEEGSTKILSRVRFSCSKRPQELLSGGSPLKGCLKRTMPLIAI